MVTFRRSWICLRSQVTFTHYHANTTEWIWSLLKQIQFNATILGQWHIFRSDTECQGPFNIAQQWKNACANKRFLFVCAAFSSRLFAFLYVILFAGCFCFGRRPTMKLLCTHIGVVEHKFWPLMRPNVYISKCTAFYPLTKSLFTCNSLPNAEFIN